MAGQVFFPVDLFRIRSWPYGITYFWLLGQVLCEAQRREHSRSCVSGVVTKPSDKEKNDVFIKVIYNRLYLS